MIIDSSFKNDLKESVVNGVVSMIILAILTFLTPGGWLIDASTYERVIYSVKFGFMAFFLIGFFNMFVLSIFAPFSNKDASGKARAIIAVVVFLLLTAWVSFTMYDRYSFAQKASGVFISSEIPSSVWDRNCENMFIEYSIQKKDKNILLRCGAYFYPLYEEVTIPIEKLIMYLPKPIREDLKKNEK